MPGSPPPGLFYALLAGKFAIFLSLAYNFGQKSIFLQKGACFYRNQRFF
jgi:hypothetical protein